MELRVCMDVEIGSAFPLSCDFLEWFNELGVAGGQQRRHGVFASHVQPHAGIQEPEIEVKISSTEKFERLVYSYEKWCIILYSFNEYQGMKNSLPKRQHKKKVPKTITG
ncbi:hypothetical protein DKX38_002071 [Salix brachista]|uniref:Uncharacterized protein n=1 Tax=Salix brachista TaxID=2182728 RepID=A0A5N5NMZ5_9ROSI|nr:hypothetical protein DKX38_002071 [Salix brachista]